MDRVVAPALIGRATERERLTVFIDLLAEQSGVVIVEGEAGIGKSALWLDAVAHARTADLTVLAARPAEAEASLAWCGLSDLLADVGDQVLADLPPPQRHALDVALLKAAPGPTPPAPIAVWAAFRSIVDSLRAEGPVLIAIDDAQWLDAASMHAVAFVARRLPAQNVGLLGAARAAEAGAPRFDFELPDVPVERLVIGSLAMSDLFHLVKEHLGVSLSRPALHQVHRLSGGNPLFAIELARGRVSAQEPALPASLWEFVAARVESLSDEAIASLAAAAVTAQPTVSLLVRAKLDTGLAEAERAGIVEIGTQRITFTHPLFASAAHHAAPPDVRRRVRAQLAAHVDSVEERARHLALAAVEPDDSVAATLDDAVRRAVGRGATEIAADLAGLAVELTVPGSAELWHRRLVLGEQLFRVGESAAAAEHLNAVLANEDAVVATRARAADLLAVIAYETGRRNDAVTIAEQALALAGDDATLLAGIHTTLANVLYDDNVRSAEHARRALALLEQQPTPDPAQLAAALVASAEADFMIGKGLNRDAYARATELEAQTVQLRVRGRADATLAVSLKYADDLGPARAAFLAVRQAAEAEGDESSLPYALSHLPQIELWAGNWDLAERYAREHMELAEQTGQGAQRKQAEFNLALVAAHRGDVEAARRIGADLVTSGVETGEPWSERTGQNLLGFVAFSEGDHAGAVRHFDRALELSDAAGLYEPGLRRNVPNHVEALLLTGQGERAEAVLARYEEQSRDVDRPSALGGCARCRALMLAADGDSAAALKAADESLAAFDRVGMPFERARTLLVKGQIHRRSKEKRAALESLGEALRIFESLGSPLWAARARHERDRVNVRAAAPLELTATERRVAELAAQGMTNREIATSVFISPKTVEANLARAYRKLGITSRAELGVRLKDA